MNWRKENVVGLFTVVAINGNAPIQFEHENHRPGRVVRLREFFFSFALSSRARFFASRFSCHCHRRLMLISTACRYAA